MANGQNMTAEEFTTSVAEAIAAQLKIDASALVTRLVDSLSKGLIKEFTKKGPLLAEKPKTTETAKQKAEATKLPKIEISLPKILETQFSKLDDISKSLNKLANKKDVVVDNRTQKPAESSFGVLGNTLQKILQIANKPSEKASINLIDSKVSKSQEPSEKSSFGVLGNTLQKILGSFRAPSEPTKAPEIIKPLVEIVTKEAPKPTSAVPPKVEAPKSLLEEKVEAKPVIIAGISESGLKDLSEHLPSIIRQGMEGLFDFLQEDPKKKKEGGGFEFPGMGIIGGALGVLSTIGGLFTLLYGLQTDGPYKGLAKLVGRGALAIGDALTKPLQNFIKNVGSMLIDIPINMIKSAGETFSKQFKTFSEVATKIGSSKFIAPLKEFAEGIAEKLLSVPLKMLSSFKSSLGDLFGKVGGEAVKTGLGKLSEFLPKFMGGALKVISKVPFVGSLISIGFAVSRFMKGDVVGGGLDLLSGIANAFGLAPLGWAIDALNAFLDFKTGGIGEGKKGKGSIIMDWIKGMGSWLFEKAKEMPFVGNLIKAGEAFSSADWAKGLVQLSRVVPGIGWVYDMIGITEEKQEAIVSKDLDAVKNLFEWIRTSIWDKVKGIVGGTVDTVKDWWNEAVNFVTGEDEAPVKPVAPVKQVGDAKVKPDGGLVVSSPTEGALFQTSKNDIIEENTPSSKPGSIFQLNKDSGITAAPITNDVSSPKSSSIASTAANIGNSDKILTQIANNTETTNKSIAGLANGFNVLAKSLERLGVSVANQSPTVINNVSGGSKGGSSKVSSSQIASAGNSTISSFRSGIEASRFVPA
jgi:hypothetical protein